MDEGVRAAWSDARPGRVHGHEPICVAPWVSLELDPSGWVYACCANQMYPLGRIGEQRLADLWGGPRAQVLRSALARWDLSVGCGMCRWHLEHGRMDPDAAVYDRYPMASDAPDGPVAMTFALSNRCNLGCTMCTPELSSTLRHAAGMAPLASPYDDEFFDDLATFLPGLQYAKFLGGEPFLIPEHHRAWDLMAETGCRARLQVTTNGTVWNERVQRLLERFQVDVTVSIDGATASTYEAIRRGASFDVVAANIDRFRAACERAGTELRLCFCLMPDNAHELAAMVRWTDRLGAALSVNVVTDLGLALHDLPLADLEAVRSGWAREDEVGGLGRNEQVWRVQLEQMDAVLAERRAGIGPPARQAVPATAAGLALPSVAGAGGWSVRDADAAARSTERGALEDWCERGEVAELVLTHAGTVTEVRSGHDRLGVGAQLVGSSIDELVGAIAEADGRPPWTLGVDDGRPGRVVHSLILSASPPVRGAHGSSVRIVLLAADDGVVALIAEDRIYEDRTGVVVEAPTRR